jgi:Trypsin
MHQRLLSAALAATLGSAGCGAREPTATERQRVLGGTDTGYDHAGVLYVTSEVGLVGGNSYVKIGSGSLVAPNLVLTALHVVSSHPSNIPFTCDANGNAKTGADGAELGPLVEPEKVAVFAGPFPEGEPVARGKLVLSTGSSTICQNDVALVVLDTALDFPTYAVHRGDPTAIADAVTVVGYGTAPGMEGAARTQRNVQVTAVGQWIRTFTVGAGPCEGDSGGPALNAEGEIVGVFSTVGAGCASQASDAKYSDISYFTSLVDKGLSAAGVEPSGAGGQAAAGSSGEGGDPSSAGGTAGTSEPEPPAKEPGSSGCSAAPKAPAERGSSLAFVVGLCWLGHRARERRRAHQSR